MSEFVDSRGTFLLQHVTEQLEGEFGAWRDILMLEHLRASRKGNSSTPSNDLKRFYYGEAGETPCYEPLQVAAIETDRNRHAELSQLIGTLPEGRGISLEAESGAGKTAACRKAFCDCVWAPVGQTPILQEFTPCWLDLTCEEQGEKGLRLIKKLVGRASGLDLPADLMDEYVERWIRHGPRLLIFADLTTSSYYARDVGQALIQFQSDRDFGRHCCVVTRRSVNDVSQPSESPFLARYTLAHPTLDQARAALKRVRQFYAKEGLSNATPEEINAEQNHLKQLGARCFNASSGSIASTPLVWHFLSLVSPSDVQKLGTVFNLYDRVVSDMLDREHAAWHRNGGRQDLITWKNWMRVGLTRVALMMNSEPNEQKTGLLSRIQPTTRLAVESARQGLEHPELKWQTLAVAPLGHHDWSRSSYVTTQFNDTLPLTARDVLKHGPFRQQGTYLGFIHDSLISYFAGGYLLGAPSGPQIRLGNDQEMKQWIPRVVAMLRGTTAQRAWKDAAEFLGSSLQTEHKDVLQELVAEFLIQEDPTGHDIHLLLRLLRGHHDLDDTVLSHVLEAIETHAAGALLDEPGSFFSIVYRQLMFSQSADGRCEQFASHAARRQTRPWVRQVAGPPPTSVRVMSRHDAPITSLDTDGNGMIASGSHDGRVILWDWQQGTTEVVDRHGTWILGVTFDPNGNLHAIGLDGTVRSWRRNEDATWQGEATRSLYEGPNSVRGSLDVLAMTKEFLIVGGKEGNVDRYDLASGRVEHLYSQEGPVQTLAASQNGQVVTSAGGQRVFRWSDGDKKPETVIKHSANLEALVIRDNDYQIFAGFRDGLIRSCVPGALAGTKLGRPRAGLRSLAVYSDAELLIGTAAGSVLLWNPNNSTTRQIMGHTSRITALMVDRNGCVVAASQQATAKLWQPRRPIDEPT